jgi:hypothetical protein
MSLASAPREPEEYFETHAMKKPAARRFFFGSFPALSSAGNLDRDFCLVAGVLNCLTPAFTESPILEHRGTTWNRPRFQTKTHESLYPCGFRRLEPVEPVEPLKNKGGSKRGHIGINLPQTT